MVGRYNAVNDGQGWNKYDKWIAAGGMTDEERKLVEDNLDLTKGAYDRYVKNSAITTVLTKEDIWEALYFGLCYAAHKYDPSKGCKFSTLAYTIMYREVLNWARDKSGRIGSRREILEGKDRQVKYFQGCTLEGSRDIFDDPSINRALSISCDMEYRIMEGYMREQILNALNSLDTKYRDLVYNVVILEKPLGEYGRSIGKSQATISRWYKVAKEQLRPQLMEVKECMMQ